MEDRIKRMESVITTSALKEAASVDEKEEESLHEGIESQAELSNHLANLVVDPEGSPNFIGMSLGQAESGPANIGVQDGHLVSRFYLPKDFGVCLVSFRDTSVSYHWEIAYLDDDSARQTNWPTRDVRKDR